MNAPHPIHVVARDARVEIDGVIACDRLTFEADGGRIVIGGSAVGALAAALTGRGVLTSGSLTVDGLEVAGGSHFGHVGIAPLDPPMPAHATAQDFVALALRIAGSSTREARHASAELLALTGLQRAAARRIGGLALAERRALAVAQAMTPGCRVLFAEAPLAGLEPAAASFVLAALAAASRSRPIVATALRFDPLAPERDLFVGSDRVVILSGDSAAWNGDPAELLKSAQPLLLLQLRGGTEAFTAAAREASIEIRGTPPRILARLPEGMPRCRLFELAQSTETVILELLPVWP